MFDDEITVIEVNNEDLLWDEQDELVVVDPPPLPFPLQTRKTDELEAWIGSLPERVRAVLEAARNDAPRWPIARRIPGAVAQPLMKLPTL